MNNLIFLLSIWLAKLLSLLISTLHIGQASNFPGKIALSFKKDLVKHFRFKKESRVIYITGTNGKSTTTGLIANILKASGKKVIYNTSGANLLSGITSTLCHYSDLFGLINCDYLIIEVDEATLPLLTKQISAHLIVVTNFFRDQLDRFGELDTTVKLIEKGISNNKDATLILNADDSRVAFLKNENKKVFFGLSNDIVSKKTDEYNPYNSLWSSDPEEVTTCPVCYSNFIFENKFLSHLGNYKCSSCNIKRPEISFLASNMKTDPSTINIDIVFNSHRNNFFIPLIGIFNLYNSLCAITVTKTIANVTNVQIQKGLQTYSSLFGRNEKISLKNKTAWIYLIKNPTGTTEVLKTLSTIPKARFLIAINDNHADGRDVSWLWDARFDILANHKKEIYLSGKRAWDIALRLKYSNINQQKIIVNENLKTSILNALNSISKEETLYILPTYTALLEMQRTGICKSSPLSPAEHHSSNGIARKTKH